MAAKTNPEALLLAAGRRLPAIKEWLRNEIWCEEMFKACNATDYLEQGEREVCRFEDLAISSAWTLYNELYSEAAATMNLIDEFRNKSGCAIVVFDGLSVREMPLIAKFAADSGLQVISSNYHYGAAPSDTGHFISSRILDKKSSPSTLPRNRELHNMGIKVYHYESPTRRYELDETARSLLLWSAFPDATYMNLSARFAEHFGEMCTMFEAAWKNIVLAIPKSCTIYITSDHGYIFFGPGMESSFPTAVQKLLHQERFHYFSDGEQLPGECPELQIDTQLRLAMLRGRIKNRPQGHTGNRAYRHGGLSLMETLVPWMELKYQ